MGKCSRCFSRSDQFAFVGGTVSVRPCLSMFVAVPLAPTAKIPRASLTSPGDLIMVGLIEMFQLMIDVLDDCPSVAMSRVALALSETWTSISHLPQVFLDSCRVL